MARAHDTIWLAMVVAASATGVAATAAAQGQSPISHRAQELLAGRCFPCHGPDARARQADLRLDRREGVLGVVDLGEVGRSEVLRRVASTAGEERMPPPGSKLPPLDAAERDLLREWIEAGVPWQRHWAFEPLPAAVAVPAGAAHPVDAFIDARLRELGVPAQSAAAPEVWLRRASQALTGLPPTVEAIDAFLAEPAADRRERAIDGMLASVRYGERMASAWLDAARYADTHGYQADRQVRVWPWRDWVVRAFAQNLPYDEFVTWQLAGDLLPGATLDQRLATAFQRLHRQTEEGGTIEEEFRVEYVADRVDTFGTAFLGLTVACARCHDHKFDPITARDYYGLFAFFQNIDESGQTSHFTQATPVPALDLPDAAQERALAAAEAALARAEEAMAAALGKAFITASKWGALGLAIDAPAPIASFSLDELVEGGYPDRVDPARRAQPVDAPQPVDGARAVDAVEAPSRALRFHGDNGLTVAGLGQFHREDPFTLDLWVRPEQAEGRAVLVHKTKAALDAGSCGYTLHLEDGRLAFTMAHMWPGDALAVVAKEALPLGVWSRVTAVYDGSSRAAGVRLYRDGQRVVVEVVRDQLHRDIVYGSAPPLTIAHRFRDRGFRNGAIDELQVFDVALNPAEVETICGLAPTGNALASHYVARVDRVAVDAARELHAARRAQREALDKIPQIMAVAESAEPRPAFVLQRGAYDAPGEPVVADTPAVLPPLGDRPRNRLGLAQWLTDPGHPLTARVAVNRLWQALFGVGLVESGENFGTRGEAPSHPELLDWLARRFVDSGWDVKGMVRLLATSDAFGRSSKLTPELAERDPRNRAWARGPAHALDAEVVRDGVLLQSGLLDETVGGRPVHPYQPDGLWREVSGQRYVPGTGSDLYRRSLYTVFKRTAPPPTMIAFGMPRRSECTVRRQRSSTAQQALILMNDPQYVEAARVTAEALVRRGGDEGARLVWVYRAMTSLRPGAAELEALRGVLEAARVEFGAAPERAAALLEVGARPKDAALPAAEVAAWTLVVSTVLNHEMVVVQR